MGCVQGVILACWFVGAVCQKITIIDGDVAALNATLLGLGVSQAANCSGSVGCNVTGHVTSLFVASTAGTIATDIAQLTTLTYLHLTGAMLTGTAPTQLGRLTALNFLCVLRSSVVF